MKNIKNFILESITKLDRDTIENECPNFYRAVSQFCRDKNSEEGVDYIIYAFLASSPEDFNKKYKNNQPFTASEMHEFEEKYLNDDAEKELEKFQK